jgi:hypothetical protein
VLSASIFPLLPDSLKIALFSGKMGGNERGYPR